MGNEFFGSGDGNEFEGEGYQIPGVSPEELKALEDERTIFDETEVQTATRLFRQSLIGAVSSVSKMALHSTNERIRLSAAQYIIERNMGRVQDQPPAPADDPLKELMAAVVTDVDMDKIRAEVAAGVVSDGVIEDENANENDGSSEGEG